MLIKKKHVSHNLINPIIQWWHQDGNSPQPKEVCTILYNSTKGRSAENWHLLILLFETGIMLRKKHES